jgi:quercetin dioxygenase-like cupin family protein
MRIFTLSQQKQKSLESYSSQGAEYTPIYSADSPTRSTYISLKPGGMIGRHIAPIAQIIIVLQGTGKASSSDRILHDISAGQAVAWEAGEDHEIMTETGMQILVIEGDFELHGIIT